MAQSDRIQILGQSYKMLIIWFGALLIVIATAAAMFSIISIDRSGQSSQRRLLFATVLLLVIITTIGIAWEKLAWRSFAREAGQFKGMVARPMSNYIDSSYTPKGHYYQRWGFVAPAIAVALFLGLVSFVASILAMKLQSRLVLLGIWSSAAACAILFAMFTIYKYLVAADFFI